MFVVVGVLGCFVCFVFGGRGNCFLFWVFLFFINMLNTFLNKQINNSGVYCL